jgi:CheY-like chemotaxis protein
MGSEPSDFKKENSDDASFSLKGKRIFIVEDDAFLGNILSQRIASETNDLLLFNNGEDVLKAIDKNIPDLILLDVLLPGMDGFKVLEAIRGNEKTKHIPVLIVSNTNQLENEDRAKKLGAQFLLKALVTPFEIVEHAKKILQEQK